MNESKSPEKFAALRRELLRRQAELGESVRANAEEALRATTPEAVGNSSALPTHLADLGTDVSDQTRTLTLLEREERELAEINQALERLANGDYGICEGCEEEIPMRRLEVLPEARLCVECEEDVEKRPRSVASSEGRVTENFRRGLRP